MAICSGTGRRGRHRRAAHLQAQEGQYFPGFLEPRRLAEKARTFPAQFAGPCRQERARQCSSLLPSPRRPRKRPVANGAPSPIRSVPRCPSSPRSRTGPTTCSPTWPSQGASRPAPLHQPIGRVNGEIKRRTKVVGIFPTTAPSSDWSAPSCYNKTKNGRAEVATLASVAH